LVALVGQDHRQVLIVEAPGQRGGPEGLVDRGEAVQLGQRHGLGHLGAHPSSARRGGLAQPLRGAGPDGQERLLGRAARPGDPVTGHRPPRGVAVGVVLVADLRAAAPSPLVAGDFAGPVLGLDDGDHELVAGEPGPDPGVDQLMRHRVAHPPTEMVASHPTRRVSPNAVVTGSLATGAARAAMAAATPKHDPSTPS
jgi:hypothetical protein